MTQGGSCMEYGVLATYKSVVAIGHVRPEDQHCLWDESAYASSDRIGCRFIEGKFSRPP